jgi:hypothetical protein
MPYAPLTVGASGDNVAQLQNALRQLGLSIPASEASQKFFGAGTRQAVQEVQRRTGLLATGIVDEATAKAIVASAVESTGVGSATSAGLAPSTNPSTISTPITANGSSDGNTYAVSGTVVSPDRAGVGGLTVQIVDKTVGPDALLATTMTDSWGNYTVSVSVSPTLLRERRKTQPDLQVRVSVGTTYLASSDVRYNATSDETLNVTLPANTAALPSEYETLLAAISASYGGSVRALEENEERSDITYLANKTGWDARAVAMAALADQFGTITAPAPTAKPTPSTTRTPAPAAVSLQPAFYYALFRAGLPANVDGLFRIGPTTVQSVWQQAIAQGVIPAALKETVTAAVQSFQTLSAAHTLTAAPVVGISTLQLMIAPTLAKLSDQQLFTQLFVQYRENWSEFWPAVEKALGSGPAKQLQLLGQLYFLTINNQPLVAELTRAETRNPLTSTLDLATRGYYDPAKWEPLIGSSIPPGFPGANQEDLRSNYAQFLAAQVRVSFPTAVVADEVRRKILPIPDTDDVIREVVTFLTTNQGQFELGVEPVETYLLRNNLVGTPASVVTHIKRLQRVLQLTRDDTTMGVLLRHNLDSAFAITRYDAAGFSRAFAAKLGGADKASAVHARAKQIFGAVLNIATAYGTARAAPALGGATPFMSASPTGPDPSGYSAAATATLEDLFGSLDYCNCPDCRSILSPAAYLVDLLNYLDQPSPTPPYQNPQDVLFSRRPDLQYLPLTCENTNTALPYIDLVNETLEYYVANNLSLANYQGHDTGSDVTSAELLASPPYVNEAAYSALRAALFPSPLPFNRPLALLRSHLQALNVSLPDAMTALRATDSLSGSGTPTSYGWSDILIERLGMSRDESRLFTDSNVQLGDLYGLPNAAALPILQTMSLRDFSRRVSVAYSDLVTILETQFINPNAILIPRLQQLNAPFSTLQALQANPSSVTPGFIKTLPAGLDATKYGGSSPTDYQAVVNWVTDPHTYPRIMSLITITNPSGSSDDCSGASLQFRYANPVNTQNLLSATDFIKLIRFIRFWQKLAPLLGSSDNSVTISQTDAILSALYRPAKDITPEGAWRITLRRAGFLFQTMSLLSLTADSALDQLLACWANIGTVGPNSLYKRMFLTPTILQQDAGSQVAIVGNAINAGDKLDTSINGVPIPTQTVGNGDDATAVAANIAAAINATTTTDPMTVTADPTTALALNKRFRAMSSEGVVTITAGFSLKCSVSPNPTSASPTETYNSAFSSPVSQTATVGGSPSAGDTLITTLDGVDILYTVAPSDSLSSIAAGIAIAINTTTVPDPFSGVPLNTILSAEAAGPVVTITTANAGAPFTLTCVLSPATAGTYTVGPPVPPSCTATVGGSVSANDTLTTTFYFLGAGQGVDIPYMVKPSDRSTDDVAAGIALTLNQAVQRDPTTQLSVSNLIHATSAGSVVTVNPVDPSTNFAVQCAFTGSETYTSAGPFPARQTATVVATIPAGAILTTTINGVDAYYPVAAKDTPNTIAAAMASAINDIAAQTEDPTTGVLLSKEVAASASGTTITVTAQPLWSSFTLSTALTAGSYTAARQLPPFADDGYGDFLPDPKPGQSTNTPTLFGHEPALCAACNLTGAEFGLIAQELKFDASTPLTLTNVSALFRYGWLAHAMGSSVLVFLRLRQFSGLDPFAPLDPGATSPVEPPIIQFVRLAQTMTAVGIQPFQALYLLWNQDISGKSAPPSSDVTGLAFALRGAFAAVEAQFTLQVDPSGTIAKGLMTLVYSSAATDFFFGLLNDTFITSIPYGSPAGAIPQAVINASGNRLSSSGYRLGYTDLSKQLSFTGVFDTNTLAAVTAAAGDPTLSAALTGLQATNQQAVGAFFATYPELKPLYAAYATSTDPLPDRRTALLSSFLPTLKQKRKQEQALATITAALGTDPSFANTLLPDPTILHADADPSAPALTDLLAIENTGLSAHFFVSNNPAVQTTIIGGTIKPGDTLTTTINGVPIPCAVSNSDTTLALLAAHVATVINGTTLVDPVSKLAINQVVTASSNAATVLITAATIGGTLAAVSLACAVSASASETYTIADQTADDAAPPAYVQTAIVGGTITQGDTLTTRINGVAIPYSVGPSDTSAATPADQLAALAGHIASKINGTTTLDPVSGRHINQLVTAWSNGNAVLVGVASPGGALGTFSLACSVPKGATETYTAPQQPPDDVAALVYVQTATIGGTITVNDVLTTTINNVPIPYQVQNSDSTPVALAGSIVATINRTKKVDATTNLPINQLVTAWSNGNVVLIGVTSPSGANAASTLACSVSVGATETYTPGTQLPANAGNPIAGTWAGYVAAPQDGFYDILVTADSGAQISLSIDNETVEGATGPDGVWRNQSPVSLVANTLTPINLTATSLKTTFQVSWQSLGLGLGPIPSQYLYPLNPVKRLGNTYVRFLKTTSLATTLSLTADEIAFLGTSPTFAVNTTDATAVTAGNATFAPAAMTNIAVGSALVVDTGAAQEVISVTQLTPPSKPLTFSATTARAHDGSTAPFPIVGQASPDVGHGWLNFLATTRDPDLATAARLGTVLVALLDFARIKQALSPSDERLLAVLKNPVAKLSNGLSALLSLTGWDQASLNALLNRLSQFFGTTSLLSLSDIENFRRVYDAYALVRTCRVSASTLVATITNAPSATTVSALQSALRAQYAESDWLAVVRPINDAMRIRQRDALVAYILQQSVIPAMTSSLAPAGSTQLTFPKMAGLTAGMAAVGVNVAAGSVVMGMSSTVSSTTVTLSLGLTDVVPAGSIVVFDAADRDTADKLFEYFLIDPLTQPPVDTSRIRLALSSVQLFIERIVRNLEPQVSPTDVDVVRWQSMKRYRLQQANLETFLWPENWLYPELRDDQSPFFTEMMGKLFQSDMTDDAAANAYLDYLTNLEEVAKLEPCGLYYQPGDADTNEASYVVARTAGGTRKYYFRQLQNGSWTPWTQVKVDCEDMPITPIVWNGRLFLFWLKILKQSLAPPGPPTASAVLNNPITKANVGQLLPQGGNTATTPSDTLVNVQAVLCWSELYNGKWQPTKTSDINRPTTIGISASSGEDSFDIDRNLARLVPVQFTGENPVLQYYNPINFSFPPNVLVLGILTRTYGLQWPGNMTAVPGFVIYNTHSLPVRLDDVFASGLNINSFLDIPAPMRTLQPVMDPPGASGSSTFNIWYCDTLANMFANNPWAYQLPILDFKWIPRFVEPQPGLTDAWDAPFFYEDRRYLFYVTTVEGWFSISDFPGVGRSLGVSTQAAFVPSIPPLIFPQTSARPRFAAKIFSANRGSAAASLQRVLAQGTNIRVAIGANDPLMYQDKIIAPTGSILMPPATTIPRSPLT